MLFILNFVESTPLIAFTLNPVTLISPADVCLGSVEILLDFAAIKIPKTRYLLYNGELTFESVTPHLVFHSTRGRIKLIEKATKPKLRADKT